MHNWPLQLLCQFVNFNHEGHDLEFKVDSERQIFRDIFHGNFIYSESFFLFDMSDLELKS